ncbi:helix-turn-helix domain-containing protein [Nocardia fluminea]|uniref:helix-turn-helix domain-containing protein n=1 Tax=Nocardia fluminea TaxID=134984 RepID=UPI00365344C8
MLGARLRQLRRAADINGRDFAALLGWHGSKVSRAELGKQLLTEGELHSWCAHVGRPDQAMGLIAAVRNIDSASRERQRLDAQQRALERGHPALSVTLLRQLESDASRGSLTVGEIGARLYAAGLCAVADLLNANS